MSQNEFDNFENHIKKGMVTSDEVDRFKEQYMNEPKVRYDPNPQLLVCIFCKKALAEEEVTVEFGRSVVSIDDLNISKGLRKVIEASNSNDFMGQSNQLTLIYTLCADCKVPKNIEDAFRLKAFVKDIHG